MTAAYDDLVAILRRWDVRRRQSELLAALPRALAVGLALGLAAALLSRARPWLTRTELLQAAGLLAFIAVGLTALAILLRRRAPDEQARFADRQFGLRERMIAAVEIHAGMLDADAAVAARQLQDALTAAARVNAERQLPLAWRARDWLPAAAALVLLATALWLPNPQEAILREQRAVAAEVTRQADNLEALAEDMAADEALTPEQRAALKQPIDEALAALAAPDISREAAVAALSAAETELRALTQEVDGAALSRALAEAGLEAGASISDLTQALQAGDTARAGAAAAALTGDLPGLSATERAALAGELAAVAGALAATDAALAEALAGAAEALTEGDSTTAAAMLDEAASTLESRAAAAAVAEQAATSADQLGAARQAVAQAGGATETEGPEGAGQQPGSDAGAGSQTGDGAGGTAAGEGSATGSDGAAAGGPSPGGGHVDTIFVPPSTGLDEEGQALELEVQCLTEPASCGPVGGQSPSPLPQGAVAGGQVPYEQVFGDYRAAAFESLAAGDIPVRLQGIIRDYFAALEP